MSQGLRQKSPTTVEVRNLDRGLLGFNLRLLRSKGRSRDLNGGMRQLGTVARGERTGARAGSGSEAGAGAISRAGDSAMGLGTIV
jgi:hypothetical protein